MEKEKELEKCMDYVYQQEKAIDIIFKYVDEKYHKEIQKELDDINWYNKEGNDSLI